MAEAGTVPADQTATGAPAAEAKPATQGGGGKKKSRRKNSSKGNRVEEPQAGPSTATPAVLEVGAGAASSSLTVTPPDMSSTVASSLGASAAAADSRGVKASSSGGAAASASAGAGEKSVLGLQEKMKRYKAAQPKGLDDVGVPEEYMTGLLAEDTARGMANLAKQARRDNDLATAQVYEEQANVQWLKHHAHIMLYPAHMRPALTPIPFPNQLPGPPLAFQRDPNLPAWGSKPAQSAAPVPAQATAPQWQHPEQPQGQHPVLQTHVQPQPVQAQSAQAQAQPQALHTGTAPVAQAVQPEAQTVPTSTDRLNSIVEQWMPLVIQMNVHITGMQSAMAARGQVRQRMQPILHNMESNKDEMQACLGLLLELAADMAPSDEEGDVV